MIVSPCFLHHFSHPCLIIKFQILLNVTLFPCVKHVFILFLFSRSGTSLVSCCTFQFVDWWQTTLRSNRIRWWSSQHAPSCLMSSSVYFFTEPVTDILMEEVVRLIRTNRWEASVSVFAPWAVIFYKKVLVLFKYVVFFKKVFLYFKKSYVSVSTPKYAYLDIFHY